MTTLDVMYCAVLRSLYDYEAGMWAGRQAGRSHALMGQSGVE